jgi:hypothetical protein
MKQETFLMRRFTPTAAIVALSLTFSFMGRAAENKKTPAKVKPVLKLDLALLARIANLEENTWMKLPAVKTAGDLSWCGKQDWPNTRGLARLGPGTRNFCNKMAWSPDRKRTLFCGANHQAPHYLNDVWEYDLAANTWVCLSPPDPQFKGTEKWFKDNAEFKNGVFQTKSGGPIRPCHTWSGLSYDTDKRKLYWLDPLRGLAFFGSHKKWSPRMHKILGVSKEDLKTKWKPGGVSRYRHVYIWSFDPYVRKWEVLTRNMPPVGEGSATEYIPELKQLWVSPNTSYNSGSPYLYDPDKKIVKNLKAKGRGPRPELVTAYDPISRIVVAVLNTNTHVYSFATNEWKLVLEKTDVFGRDSQSFFCYDSVAKRFVLFGPDAKRKKRHLWLYNANKNIWSEPEVKGDFPNTLSMGYYDPHRNVTVACSNAGVWVYRGKKRSEDTANNK